MTSSINRRQAIAATATTFLAGSKLSWAEQAENYPPVRNITSGPLQHWFGYYDKLQFDPSDRFVLANEVAFEHRTPTAYDVIKVSVIDTHNNDSSRRLGTSQAWGWQQGCMLQWLPNSKSEVVWNDRQDDQHVARVLNIETMAMRTLPRPIYALSNDGQTAITADFARIQRMRPGYGYVGLSDPCAVERAPAASGVWKMNMQTGDSELIFSLAQAAQIPHQGKSLNDKWNYFNHLLISPDSQRFIVLHRWKDSTGSGPDAQPTGPFTTRMFTVNMDGSDAFILDPSGNTSHFIWRDSQHICAWTQPVGKPAAFYLLTDHSKKIEVVGEGIMTENGHNTYVPNTDNEWILNDTYPSASSRMQKPYLYHVPSRRKVVLGEFHSPPAYTGEWRCDTHPRNSSQGKFVAIDSPHENGRQVYLIDIAQIVV